MTSEKAALEASAKEAEASIKELTTQKETLTSEKAALEASAKEAEASIKDLTAQVGTLTSEKKTLEETVAAGQVEAAGLAAQIQTLTSEKAALQESLTAAQKDAETKAAAIEKLTSEKTELESAQAAMTEEAKSLTSAIDTANQENLALRIKMDPGLMDMELHGHIDPDKIVYTSKSMTESVQKALNKAGYEAGKEDGELGPVTLSAMSKYAEEKGFTIGKKITGTLISALSSDGLLAGTPAEAGKPEDYSNKVTYTQLTTNVQSVGDTKLQLKGTVLQAVPAEEGKNGSIRLAVGGDASQVVMVTVNASADTAEIAEGDTITVYGRSVGTFGYSTIAGPYINIPWVMADFVQK